ncbi:helix-turn-helix domain-containing protein [Leptospira interrogans]|uniref:Bacteriophage CI repressor protein n=1 Tax=Leptospira interrogans serovar Zanoni str. LT2156 TaxID=1001601 RepID=M6HK39_LEPIR|nr:helix-turn-helix transcriptional regulator [Leptospira interrogans]EMM97475.1 bacteriophage CI repressor protein [Leptospira interrogans serovar Zanoni str. LT2156]EKQ46516.1 bacteriophage CI repressor protein [Leptospira interrogans str. 2002000623]EMJ74198.1 bacteriophage CI repressor protein [Leptospira interrogans str. 2002000632]EMJ80647.1 bacteriophage CI repressor protein [Leptospira interrogans str. 2002000631]OOB99230.1 transcriptional regulator [Leptospira interrogans serovar Aust
MGDRISLLIETLGISKKEFSSKVGISQGFLSQLISGQRTLSMETLSKISQLFRVNVHWLMTGEGEMFQPSSEELRKGIASMEDLRQLHFRMQARPILKDVIQSVNELDKVDPGGLEIIRDMIHKLLSSKKT